MSKPKFSRRGLGGLHTVHAPDDYKLMEACPVFLPGHSNSCGKGSVDSKKTFERLAQVARASRTMRQAQQAQNDKVTWTFELASIATKAAVQPFKRKEMDEKSAATKNRSIKDLGFYWRRAPY